MSTALPGNLDIKTQTWYSLYSWGLHSTEFRPNLFASLFHDLRLRTVIHIYPKLGKNISMLIVLRIYIVNICTWITFPDSLIFKRTFTHEVSKHVWLCTHNTCLLKNWEIFSPLTFYSLVFSFLKVKSACWNEQVIM